MNKFNRNSDLDEIRQADISNLLYFSEAKDLSFSQVPSMWTLSVLL